MCHHIATWLSPLRTSCFQWGKGFGVPQIPWGAVGWEEPADVLLLAPQRLGVTLVMSTRATRSVYLEKGTSLFKRWFRHLILLTVSEPCVCRQLLKHGLLPMLV